MLIDRGIRKQELQKMSNISATSIAKMGWCENVTMDVLLRIYEALDCEIQDIVERIPNSNYTKIVDEDTSEENDD